MVTTTRQITLKSTGNVYCVDEACGVYDMERAKPLFFKTPHGKRETYTAYRGQLIVRSTRQFSGCRPERVTLVYLFLSDPLTNVWFTLFAGNATTPYQAMKLIDRILDSGIAE